MNAFPSSFLHLSSSLFSAFLVRSNLQLNVVVQYPHLLARLKRWEPNVRTAITPESVAQCAVAARAYLSLDGKVHLGQVVYPELGRRLLDVPELLRGGSLAGGVFGSQPVGEPAGAVFASATFLAWFRGAFRG